MDKDILALISRDNSGFSKGQRLIAKYILENYDKAAFMTAGKLGKTALRRSWGTTAIPACARRSRR